MHDPKLAEQFHQAMLGIYEAATKLKPPYRPNDFRKLVLQHGGKAAADILLDTPDASTGFTELLLRGKEAMKLSVEYLVLSDPWNQLFSEDQIAVATERLREVGCDLPGNTIATKHDGDADDLHQGRPQSIFPPAVRILPMSAGLEFPATSIKQLQDDFFLRTLPFTHPAGAYYFRSSGLDSPTGTVVLFQFDNHLVASATLISSNRFPSPLGEYSGVLAFAPPSIRVFGPIDAQNLKAIWPSFRAFSQVKQSLDPELYPNFEKSLTRVRSPEGPVLLPGEDVPNEVYLEGGKTRVEVNAYERNWNARRACIDHHGTACKICRIDFLQLYGETARGFIHVHHIEPLSEHDGPREVDPKTDLVPVCPNCHAVLHMKTPCYTVDEVKALMHTACWK